MPPARSSMLRIQKNALQLLDNSKDGDLFARLSRQSNSRCFCNSMTLEPSRSHTGLDTLRREMPYGFADDAWERAKQQAREVLGDVARREATIPHSDLVTRIEAVAIEPDSYAMRAFLNEISTAEYDQDRGLLTAVVVYRSGDQMPGPGFFELARSLDYRFDDETVFWLEELRGVYRAWSSRGG